MPNFASPLRYPGGKGGLARLLSRTIQLNGLEGGFYAEPYAGGAGAALQLLFGEYVSHIILNDLDCRIAAFWRAILNQTRPFIDLVQEVPLEVAEWRRQREIYLHPGGYSQLEVGFATFYVNRCSRSGILVDSGPIGGVKQDGKWKLDARFNRESLCDRITKIATFRDRIEVHNLDALKFLREVIVPITRRKEEVFVYLDPPYYHKGRKLYLNFYERDDHKKLALYLSRVRRFKWLLTYDDVPAIRELYSAFKWKRFCLTYSAYQRRAGRELLIAPSGVRVPSRVAQWVLPTA